MIKNLRNKKGFTLIEIIVVVVILAVLMAVAVPSVLSYMNEADNAKFMTQANGAMKTAQIELAKAYTSKSTTYVAADETTALAAAVTEINKTADSGVEIASITVTHKGSDVNPASITKYVVTFSGTNGKVATITPNGKVVIS